MLYDLIFVKSYNGQNESMDQVGGRWPPYWGELRKEAWNPASDVFPAVCAVHTGVLLLCKYIVLYM